MTFNRNVPMPRGEGPKRKTRLTRSPFQRNGQPKPRPGRKDTIPPRVRKMVARRDEWSCARCGTIKDLQEHHRRIKGMGGDIRPHTECPCNILVLCAGCHDWAHKAGRAIAEVQGLVIPRGTALPGTVPVLVHGGAVTWQTCDGKRVTVEPEAAAAA